MSLDRILPPLLPRLVVVVALLIAAQAVKIWVRAEIEPGHTTTLLPQLLTLTHVENSGISFGMLSNLSESIRLPLLSGIALLALGMLLYYWITNRHNFPLFCEIGFVCITAGALGNLIDRLRFGVVTDYLWFHYQQRSFFVNNLEDIYISVGVGCYLIGVLYRKQQERRNSAASAKDSA